MRREHRDIEHLVEARRRFPFDGLLHQLIIQLAADESLAESGRSQKLGGREVAVVGVPGVEHHLLKRHTRRIGRAGNNGTAGP